MNSAQHQFRATADIRVPNISVFFFVLGALCLDLNLPRFEGIKTGNLAMIVLMGLSIFATALANGWRIPSPSIRSSNRLLLVYLVLVAVSAAWSPSATDTIFQLTLLSIIFLTTSIILSLIHI